MPIKCSLLNNQCTLRDRFTKTGVLFASLKLQYVAVRWSTEVQYFEVQFIKKKEFKNN